mmetsp:Transcript_1696/g.2418  ORF Transcript_1696/g.2418 Transcript_1696/m.2418 type:complete len:137 (+) Transcript_1696:158-568(+)|eukprot:CAMPEP_0203642712 /NCGR_PEP_ID=MMETSP0088-20131115/8116_1 /ASSEMBLY_ACC=CAM_ASM_001087 /TAXON_ID=426623 /ORGANISM="Chaetoceros affinis, Strain CCMP159" /LENGTH=136 /DNA_ID=CAMNT_0050498631 /DNA_START=87 /DNA_END=497 /DNA_ORIENTATION=-
MTSTRSVIVMLWICAILFVSKYEIEGYSVQPLLSSKIQANNHSECSMNRLTFLKTTIAMTSAAVLSNADDVQAKEIDPALKGTKADPAYQACLSKCVFECTKPKGDEQKSRAECIPECKQKCATSKEQLMIGTPKN